MPPVELTDANWNDTVLASELPVLVDVWAPWCIPCKRVAPMVEEISRRYEGRLVAGALNADEAPVTVARHAVMSLPTLLLFVKGEEAGRIVGVPRIDKLVGIVETHLPEG